jgi:ABC-type uncharacterized transport system substrate-binding protein
MGRAVRRRECIAWLGIATVLPTLGWAQRLPARVAFLGTGAADTSGIFLEALKLGLRENGLLEGRDYVLDVGWAEGHFDRFPLLASQMVQRNASVILAGTITAVRAAQAATKSIPIVMTSINNPISAGLIRSLARPGGNTTGVATLGEDVSTKVIELLRETLPTVATVSVFTNPTNSSNVEMFDKIKTLVRDPGIKVRSIELKYPEELDAAVTSFRFSLTEALVVLSDSMLMDIRERIAAVALRYRLPLITNTPEFTDAGALISYGPPRTQNYRRSAYFVKKILDGADPSELPVEQPTLIELSVNLKTA